MRKSLLLFIILAISYQQAFAEGNVYIVQSGDTLSTIAEKLALGFPDKHVYGKRGTLAKLVDLNPEMKNPHFLKNSKTILIGDLTILDEKERQNEIIPEDKVNQLVTNDKGQLIVPEELKISKEQQAAEDQKRLEEDHKLVEEKRLAEELRLADEKKKANELKTVEEKQKTEALLLAAEQKKAQELKAAEELRRAEELRLTEEARKAAELKAVEELKKEQDLKAAEEKKKAEELNKSVELKRAEDLLKRIEDLKRSEEIRIAEDTIHRAEESKKTDDLRRKEELNHILSLLSFSAGYQYFRIDSNDNVTKAGATLISSLCPTEKLSWKMDWNSEWSTIVEFTSIQEETLPIVQSGAVLSSGALGISTRFSFGVSRNLNEAGRLEFLVSSFENKFTRAVSTSSIVIDRVTLPEAIINYSYDLVNFKHGNIGTMLSVGYLGGGAGPGIGYSVKPGTDRNMSLYFEHKLRKFDLNIKGEFFYGIKDQDSSISTKEEKNIGGVLGVTWRFD